MQPNAISFSPGDPAPIFEGRTGGHRAFPFHAVAGRHVVLSFLGSLQNRAATSAVGHVLNRHRPWFDDKVACFFGVSADPSDEHNGMLCDSMPGVRYIRDFDLAISRLYGVASGNTYSGRDYRPLTLVLDPMLRVFCAIEIDPQERHNAKLDSAIARLANLKDHTSGADQAPVLVLPRVFEEHFCEELVARYDFDGGQVSGFMEEIDGFTKEIFEPRRKRRRDVLIAEEGLQEQIRARLGRRLVPMIQQAFQFRATRLERYLVACYDAQDGGFFKAHRDNMNRGTAHRRFAVTINLNSDFDGGDLVFPEFGRRAYRAPLGGAVVFSCSLMHEALPVTRGRRLAFLPFLHDDAAEEIRSQNQKFISPRGVIGVPLS